MYATNGAAAMRCRGEDCTGFLAECGAVDVLVASECLYNSRCHGPTAVVVVAVSLCEARRIRHVGVNGSLYSLLVPTIERLARPHTLVFISYEPRIDRE